MTALMQKCRRKHNQKALRTLEQEQEQQPERRKQIQAKPPGVDINGNLLLQQIFDQRRHRHRAVIAPAAEYSQPMQPVVAKLKELNGAYTECIIPAGTYDGIDTDTKTVAVKAIIIANGDVTDDEAYTIVSTIFENAADITTQHAKGAELDLNYAAECGLNCHPGAAKYFAEKGITVKTAE